MPTGEAGEGLADIPVFPAETAPPPLVITQEPSLQHARVAVREAFDAARRRLEDVYGEPRDGKARDHASSVPQVS